MLAKKEIFYVGFKDDTKLVDVIDANGWKWPMHWFVKFPQLNNIPAPLLSNDEKISLFGWIGMVMQRNLLLAQFGKI